MADDVNIQEDKDILLWKQYTKHWFPHLHERTYLVPPVHMNRMNYERCSFAGIDCDIALPPVRDQPKGADAGKLQVSQVREDQAQDRVLHCLHRLGDHLEQPMVVLSQLQFGDYLGKKCYEAAAKKFPRLVDFTSDSGDDDEIHRGDFDLLLITKKHGLVACEIKAIGDRFAQLCLTQEQQDRQLKKRVERAVRQLKKSKVVLTHLVSNLEPQPRVTTCLILPNISKSQLQCVFNAYRDLKQGLLECMCLPKTVDPTDFCIHEDCLPNRSNAYDVTPDVMEKLCDWWNSTVAGPYISLSDSVYEDLVARFCGPATTVNVFCVTPPPHHLICTTSFDTSPPRPGDATEPLLRLGDVTTPLSHPSVVKKPSPRPSDITTPPPRRCRHCEIRSEGEGVAETANRFSRVVLTPDQMAVLRRNHPLIWLCGPPGAGKTLVLVIKALDWLRRGYHVHVISTWSESLAISDMMTHQLRKSVGKSSENRVHIHYFDFTDGEEVEKAVQSMVDIAEGNRLKPLCIVADEMYTVRGPFCDFTKKLKGAHKNVDTLYLWAASIFHANKPDCLMEVQMLEPLRTPPAVTREIQKSSWIGKSVLPYRVGAAPLPADGPIPKVLQHEGQGHDEKGPSECELCGQNIAAVLRDLHVGVEGPRMESGRSSGTSCSRSPILPPIPAPLKYSDVFLIMVGGDFRDEETDENGKTLKKANGVVRGLRMAGYPVRVVSHEGAEAVKEIAIMAGKDEIVATNGYTVRGLERKVVVSVPKEQTAAKFEDALGRLAVDSRSTAQLIRVVWPFTETVD